MSQRTRRMADQVQRELSEMIQHDIKDPRLGGMVTISAVKVSPDMGYADVYVTVMGREIGDADHLEAAHQATLDVLNGAASFLRTGLGKRLTTRIVPRIRFHYDNAVAHGNYMTSLIAQAVADLPSVDKDDHAAE